MRHESDPHNRYSQRSLDINPPDRDGQLPLLDPSAWYGPAAEYVAEVAPTTEADPLAMFLMALAWCGASIGTKSYAKVGPDDHPPRIWPLIVGETATGRKGTAEAYTLSALSSHSDIPRRRSGLSSGEGLITAFLPDDQHIPPDPRLLVVESEWEGVLAQLKRDRNTLSPVLRDAWDGKPLGTMTVSSRLVKDHHLVVVGQLTPSAFRSGVDNLSLANGFMNRFIPILVARPRLVSWPTEPTKRSRKLLEDLIHRCDRAPSGVVHLNGKARQFYEDWYLNREARRDGLPDRVVQLTARGNVNAIRLAVILALLRGSLSINEREMSAAISIIENADASAGILLATGKVGLEAKIRSILVSKSPLSRDELHQALGRHNTSEQLNQALGALDGAGIIHMWSEPTGGRTRKMIELATPSPTVRNASKGQRLLRKPARVSR